MNWRRVQEIWDRRGASSGKLDDGVTFEVKPWDVPGEAPLNVRVCARAGHAPATYAQLVETPKTSIVLHHTSGYGHFGTLMGDSKGHGAHFMIGRDGNVYQLVETAYVAWHTKGWNHNSVGIEVDNIGRLKLGKDGKTFYDEYGGAYCEKADEGVWVEKKWPNYGDHWATWTEAQYAAVAKLLKALCAKHAIPRRMLPADRRFSAFEVGRDRARFSGICSHININPDNRDDLGPFVDWDKLIRYGGIAEADCFTGGGAPAAPKNASVPAKSAPAAPKPSSAPPAAKKTKPLPPPQTVDARTVRVQIGERPGRISLTVRAPGDPVATTPKAEPPEKQKVDTSVRARFLAAAHACVGTPWKAGSAEPKEGGVDAAGLVALCLSKAGVKLAVDPDAPLDARALAAHSAPVLGDPAAPPAGIVPGDLAWFGEGDHDHHPAQCPMIWLGDGKVLGPLPKAQHAHADKVQIVRVENAGEAFAGFSHLHELGDESAAGEAPADVPHPGAQLSAALLPGEPDALYAALQGVVKDAGGTWVSDANKLNLVGVTDLADRCQISPRRAHWNDTVFAAWVDADGHKHVLEARASLNPGHDAAPEGAWHLEEGAYTFKLRNGVLAPAGIVRGFCDETGAGTRHDEPIAATAGDILPTPLVRGLAQYDQGRWDKRTKDDPKKPLTPVLGTKTTWCDNACHPTSVTMVFRWLADRHASGFTFPHQEGTEIPESHWPRRLMEVLWPGLGGKMQDGSGIPHAELQKRAEKALGMAKGSCRLPFGTKDLEKRLAILRSGLARGPLVVNIPGHYVVVQGIAGDDLLIVDPGNVLARHWANEDGSKLKSGQGMPDKASWNGDEIGEDRNALMYVRVPIHRKVQRNAGKHPAIAPGYLVTMLLDNVESYFLPERG